MKGRNLQQYNFSFYYSVRGIIQRGHNALRWRNGGKNMRVAVVSDGGIGEFLLHLDTLRIYLTRKAAQLTIHAGRSKVQLGREILEGVCWAEVDPDVSRSIDLDQYDGIFSMRWFTEVRPLVRSLAELVHDLKLYQSFEEARARQHRALRQHYDAGLTLHNLILHSSGLRPDGVFIHWNGPGHRLLDGEYVLVCNDCDPTPSQSQTKQVPPSLWHDIIDGLLRGGHVVEVGLRASPPSHESCEYFNLTGKTSILEWASLIRHARRIVTIEGGTAHLAAVLRRPATVLCGPTDARIYGHAMHNYIDSGICAPCHWTTDRWFERCALGNGQACMYGLDPARIVERTLAQ